jgi:N-methylhydantoinase A/oxoprolinase/acetone carboxylase beta subunit
VGRILGKGYSPADFSLLCYGGGGPLHVAGYTQGVPYQDVLVPGWAAGFSAFGCACADFEYRFDRQVDVPLLPSQSDEERAQMVQLVSQTWRALEDRVRAEFGKSGQDTSSVTFTHMVRMQYYGQLVDIEVDSPTSELTSAEDAQALCDAFEQTYTRTYARGAGDRQGLDAGRAAAAAHARSCRGRAADQGDPVGLVERRLGGDRDPRDGRRAARPHARRPRRARS